MQKLLKRNTYTPTNASQVCSNCDLTLNIPMGRESVEDLKTFDNNSEENLQHSHRAGLNPKVSNIVYVLHQNGNPLMPTKPQKARRLLQCKKAKVVTKFPFTIQMLIPTGEVKQEITLGVDSGYENVGISAVTEKKEILSFNLKLRINIVKSISDKAMYRRGRRNKLWHRKPRFLNRGIPKGWLAPSILHKYNSHLSIIERIHRFLPITKIIFETATFDIQKIKHPTIKGKEYQEGEQKDFENVKMYVRHRDNYQCRNCKNKNVKLQVHHIISRKTGGDSPDNLVTLCEKCHRDYHSGKIKLNIKKKTSFKSETFMSIIRKRIIQELKSNYDNVEETFGYITKCKRLELKLEKSHINDAFCIANGSNQERSFVQKIIQKRKNNRSLQIQRNGFKPSIRKQRYDIQPYDLLRIDGKEYVSKGMQNKGKYVGILKDGKKKVISVKKVEKVFHFGTFVYVKEV